MPFLFYRAYATSHSFHDPQNTPRDIKHTLTRTLNRQRFRSGNDSGGDGERNMTAFAPLLVKASAKG